MGAILDLGVSGVEEDEFGKLRLRHEHRDYLGPEIAGRLKNIPE